MCQQQFRGDLLNDDRKQIHQRNLHISKFITEDTFKSVHVICSWTNVVHSLFLPVKSKTNHYLISNWESYNGYYWQLSHFTFLSMRLMRSSVYSFAVVTDRRCCSHNKLFMKISIGRCSTFLMRQLSKRFLCFEREHGQVTCRNQPITTTNDSNARTMIPIIITIMKEIIIILIIMKDKWVNNEYIMEGFLQLRKGAAGRSSVSVASSESIRSQWLQAVHSLFGHVTRCRT